MLTALSSQQPKGRVFNPFYFGNGEDEVKMFSRLMRGVEKEAIEQNIATIVTNLDQNDRHRKFFKTYGMRGSRPTSVMMIKYLGEMLATKENDQMKTRHQLTAEMFFDPRDW
jgi:hypothetical protein